MLSLALWDQRQEPADPLICLFSQFPDQVLWATLALHKFRALGVQMQPYGPGAAARNCKGAVACSRDTGKTHSAREAKVGRGGTHADTEQLGGTGKYPAGREYKTGGKHGQCALTVPRALGVMEAGLRGSWNRLDEDREGQSVGLKYIKSLALILREIRSQ